MDAIEKKLPQWSKTAGLSLPPHLPLEQCSSEQTALYKAGLIQDWASETFVDLTGGFGVDCYYMGRHFQKATYIEQKAELCEIVRHNYQLLKYETCQVVCGDSADCLRQMKHVQMIYLDPARRDNYGRRTYAIEDCTPNILTLNSLLLEKADKVMVKLSPMFDWHKAVSDLKGVTEVHIVSVCNECKELLLIMEKTERPFRLICVNILSDGTLQTFSPTSHHAASTPSSKSASPSTLFEPNASIMKAGCFREIEEAFGVEQISSNSHLFLSDHPVADFPGRCFVIQGVTTLNKKEIRENLKDISKANITVRNFPLSAQDLRKRLKLADGGDIYLFATTTKDKKHLIYICKK